MKIQDLIKKSTDGQFILTELERKKSFAITDCSIKEEYKHICIDFGNGQDRFVQLDCLLLTLIEFYGKDYLIDLIQKIVPYEKVKDVRL